MKRNIGQTIVNLLTWAATLVVVVAGVIELRNNYDAPILWVLSAMAGWVFLALVGWEHANLKRKHAAMAERRLRNANEGHHAPD